MGTNPLDLLAKIRKSIWNIYLAAPEECRQLVAPKFIDFAQELARTGDLSW